MFLSLNKISMNKLKSSLLLITLGFLQFGCTNDSESDLVGDSVIIDEITFTNTVKNIMDNNCVVCHAATPVFGAPMSLVTYADVKNAVQNNGLLDRISRAQGESGLMPISTRLPQATIDKIESWAENGFEE
jgi:uncharacterized membrane protein